MEVISSARSTILSGFPDFDRKYTYQHTENEATDFQVFLVKPLFLEVNKKSGLELLQIRKVGENDPEISRVKKMRVENLYCAACPKQGHDEIALGLSNGGIRLINYKTSEYTTKFPPDTSRKSVIYLDFNASNEYLSSVQENGVISLYGLKTKTKLETLNFDNNCNLSRFHPTKKFQLTVASYKGSVFVYDIQSKKRIFQAIESHKAPCRDISMSPAHPDVVLSVGYDCVINVFDIRRKLEQKIKYCHPLSTIAMSDCGNFCCVGNLKGELVSYDLRNTKNFLKSEKVHDNGVVRVAFAPSLSSNNSREKARQSNYLELSNTNNTESNLDNRKSLYNASQSNIHTKRDSFCDFIEFHSYKLKATNSRFSTRRDSFDWEILGHKNSETNTDFRLSTASRLSTDMRKSLDAKPRNYVEFDSVEVIKEEDNDPNSNDSGESSLEVLLKENLVHKKSSCEDNDRRLNYIEEEKEDDLRYSGANYVTTRKPTETIAAESRKSQNEYSDKEHVLNTSNKELEDFLKLPNEKNSTPNNCKRIAESTVKSQDVFDELQKMRSEMNAKFKQLEFEIRYTADCNRSSLFTQNWDLWKKQMDITEEIRASVECMLQTDPFVNEFIKLQKENEELKRIVQELRRKSK